MFCPNCGTSNLDDSIFCEKCGTPLTAQQQSSQTAPPAPPVPPQQQYQHPQYQQQQAMQQPSKSKKIIPVAIAAVAVVLVVALLPSIINSRRNTPPETPPAISSQTKPEEPSGQSVEIGSGSANEPAPASPVAPSEEAWPSDVSYTSVELPKEEDFAWFYDAMLKDGGGPGTAVKQLDAASLGGAWKVSIYRAGDSGSAYSKEFQRFNLIVSGDSVEADVEWSGYIENDGVWHDGVGASPDHYSGSIIKSDTGSLSVDMTDYYGNNIYLMTFWAGSGKQYAYGWYTTKYVHEGLDTTGKVAFCRP